MSRDAHYQAVLDDYQASRRLPTLVGGVLEGGTLAWAGTAGGATTVDTQYRIGSITKTITAVLVLQCRAEGLLDLADPIGTLVPETGYAAATVRELLSHSSGMQSEPVAPWWERSEGLAFDELNRRNDGSGRVFGAGEAFHYSNLGFALLGEAVARIRGASWWDLVRSRVLEPLGMARTSYLPDGPAADGLSVHHLRGTLTDEPATDTRAMAPAGQLWSTVGDLATFATFLRTGHDAVLGVEPLREMQAPVLDGYGLGTSVGPYDGGTLVGHLGSMPGFQAVCLVDTESGDGVVALTNGTTGFMGYELAQRLLGTDTPATVEPWVPTTSVPEWASPLLGAWHWGNSAFEIRWQNGVLELRDLARGVVSDRFEQRDDRIVGIEGYHRGETLHVVTPDAGFTYLECATFVYTREPYDPRAPIPGGAPG